jgi:hypothetical protein
MTIFALSDRRPASLADVLTRAKLPVLIMAVATLHFTGNQAMSQPNCDLVKIAEDYARTRWPVDMTTDRRVRTWLEGDVWKVAFELPADTLGFVPEIGIDRTTCQVVSAMFWQ